MNTIHWNFIDYSTTDPKLLTDLETFWNEEIGFLTRYRKTSFQLTCEADKNRLPDQLVITFLAIYKIIIDLPLPS